MVGDIIAAVVARLNANRGVDPTKKPGDAGYIKPIPSYIGEMYVNQNDSPPRLVWIPTTDSFGPPVRIGQTPRALRGRVAGLDCAVWGPIDQPSPADPLADLTGTEELLRQVVVALHQEMRARFGDGETLDISGAEWLQPGQITNRGMVCLLRLALKVPVLVDAPTTGVVETITITKSISEG